MVKLIDRTGRSDKAAVIVAMALLATLSARPAFAEDFIRATGTLREAKPWAPNLGPRYEMVFDVPLNNVYTDGASEEPEKEVARWTVCKLDELEYLGKKVSIEAVPTPAYAETLCLDIRKITILKP